LRKVAKNNPVPIYHQLKEIIQEMIDNEELKPNDPIPTERELCEIHGISRMTVREAMKSLVNEGVLYREQGKGTFVAKPKSKHQLSELRGLTEDMEQMGHKIETRVLSFQVIEAEKNISKILHLSEDQNKAIKMKRLRIVDQVPYSIETVWLNHQKCFNLTKECIEGQSLYEILRERYSLIPHYARQTVEPIKLSKDESELLGLGPEVLALLFRRTTYTTNDEVIEYAKGIYRIDKHKFEIVLKA
jgi:GntR family transcriptional regulator